MALISRLAEAVAFLILISPSDIKPKLSGISGKGLSSVVLKQFGSFTLVLYKISLPIVI